MFAIPGIIALLTFIYVRPQEIAPALAKIPMLYMFLALSVLGLLVDLRLRITKPTATPQLLWVVLFTVWCIINTALLTPGNLFMVEVVNSGVTFVLFFVLAQSIQTFKAFQLVATVIIGVTLLVTLISVHQGSAPLGCVVLDAEQADSTEPDGRSCMTQEQCVGPDAEPGAEYKCEHVGLFQTTSINERVRYRGVLKDPNDLSLTVSAGLALLIGLAMVRRKSGTSVLLVIGGILVAICVGMTQSRGGQLVFLSVLGVYFVRRFGWRGIAFAVVLAAPLMLMGGRSGSEASQSSDERYEAWGVGLGLVQHSPVIGIGKGAFGQHHHLTAHNAYVLAPSELGMVGMLLWSIILYLSIKIPYRAVRDFADVEEAAVARAWGMALLAAMAGIMVGIVFLSFTYHYILWIYFGLCGALYSAIKSHAPQWRVSIALTEIVFVLCADIGILLAIRVITKLKGF